MCVCGSFGHYGSVMSHILYLQYFVALVVVDVSFLLRDLFIDHRAFLCRGTSPVHRN